ncbi:MAG TPA: nitrilase-related carbon-nitrogen hydrolase [Acidobacteriaceae bacterium]|nr:nitrilase-related carbon-nitrogen hydrolase [Acidobacteriaceae bacterium]
MDWHANSLRRAIVILCAVVLTAGAYFISSGLHRLWWPVWFAPLPVLLLAPRSRGWQTFAVALVARALAALNFWNYDRHVVQLPLGLALAAILVPAFFFALAVILYRGLLRNGNRWLATLAFPVTMVAAEYLISLSQGTFIDTGYTQLENLPILQLAAITGIWGIGFSVNLFPAGLAALVSAPPKPRLRMAAALAAFYVGVVSYGVIRLYATPPAPNSVLVGLVETHAGQNIFPPDAQTTMALMLEYASQVQSLAARGAQFVVLPEMTALIPDSASAKLDAFWQQIALDAHVQILLGVLHNTDHGAYNEARLYSTTGKIETVYRKHHLVPTWESRSTPGTGISVLACPRVTKENRPSGLSTAPQPAGKIGIEICRDLDYPELARRYAMQQVGLVLAPAWDMGVDVDATWHGHLSVMRGVESGFTMVRDAKVGLLTVSDDRGRILAEQPTRSDGGMTILLASVPVRHDSTLYQKWGDWFAWVDLTALAALLAFCANFCLVAHSSRSLA